MDRSKPLGWLEVARGYSQPLAANVAPIHFMLLVSVMPGEDERRTE
jgi:hypothetical protein